MRKSLLGLLLIAVAAYTLWPKFTAQTPPEQTLKQQLARHHVRLYNHQTDTIETIPLEEYIIGVVAAEMPAAFPSEALKVQAVAARTYIAWRLLPGGIDNPTHPGADVCDDPRHGQAWLNKDQMRERWGKAHYWHYYVKIKWAVQATKNQVLTYQNQLITAAYHASCGGQGTENSGDVWQTELPYLKSVSCPYCADPEPVRTVSYPVDKVAERLNIDLNAVPALAGAAQEAITVIDRTATGRPKTLLVNNIKMPATAFRDMLALRSTQFTYKIEGNNITFTTTGYGHGVGMCQYGAKGLAEHGQSYRQILAHYYPGTTLTELE